MRIFRDSVNPALIPLCGLAGVMGYANGRFRWTAEQTARFTCAGLQVAHIDVDGTGWEAAAIADVETGDLGPAQAARWIRQRNALCGDATIYCGLGNCPALFAATSQLKETWWLWLAHWTGRPDKPDISLPSNVRLMGVQYLNAGDYDETAVFADDWHRRAA